jgi:hypothetical protein
MRACLLTTTLFTVIGCQGEGPGNCALQASLSGAVVQQIDMAGDICLEADSVASDGSSYRGAAFDVDGAEVWVMLPADLGLKPEHAPLAGVPAEVRVYSDDGRFVDADGGCWADIDSVSAKALLPGGRLVDGVLWCDLPLIDAERGTTTELDGEAAFRIRVH